MAESDSVILSVRLKSGGFESSIELPVQTTPERRDECVKQWLGMMQAGLAMAGADVNATVSWPVAQEPSHDR